MRRILISALIVLMAGMGFLRLFARTVASGARAVTHQATHETTHAAAGEVEGARP
jgi:hypothetical protein